MTSSTPDILAKIVATKQREIAALKPTAEREDWQGRAQSTPTPVSFFDSLTQSPIGVIAEIKKASPSAGVIRPDFDPASIARSYETHGAQCLSVLTDAPYFQGSIEHLRAVRQAVRLPLLRKEFVLDELQVAEAKLAGASAVLLIAECLTPERLATLVDAIFALGMEPLVELHDRENLPTVLATKTRLVGINNRNLRTFVTDLRHTLDLLDAIPRDRVVVSESGIKTRADVHRLRDAGVGAILVGEAFMRAPEPGAKLAELLAE